MELLPFWGRLTFFSGMNVQRLLHIPYRGVKRSSEAAKCCTTGEERAGTEAGACWRGCHRCCKRCCNERKAVMSQRAAVLGLLSGIQLGGCSVMV